MMMLTLKVSFNVIFFLILLINTKLLHADVTEIDGHCTGGAFFRDHQFDFCPAFNVTQFTFDNETITQPDGSIHIIDAHAQVTGLIGYCDKISKTGQPTSIPGTSYTSNHVIYL